jgi:hypothetical protein
VFGAATGALLSVEVSRQNLGSESAPNLCALQPSTKKVPRKIAA